MAQSLFYIIIFPGFLFLNILALFAEYVDRKLYARFQNRIGPPFFQPFADIIKLFAKEDIIPEDAEPSFFKILPIVAMASVLTAFIYIPVWKISALFSFYGDVIIVLYLLTIPTVVFFLAGWYSASLYSIIGAVRAITQLFGYEVPLFMGILSAALLADSWSLSEISAFYNSHPFYCLFNIIGFIVCLIALLGKLEKVPFDIPEAETEIVAGTFTEYSGRLLALFRLTIDIEMVVGASLLAAVFLPFGFGFNSIIGFIFFIMKILFIIFLLALLRTIFARLRIDQMVNFCWKYLAPASILQLFINLIVKGVI